MDEKAQNDKKTFDAEACKKKLKGDMHEEFIKTYSQANALKA